MTRAKAGATAKKHGKNFEAILEQWFALQPEAWVDIRKQNEALKPVKPIGKGQFLAVYTKPSGCDYFGTVMGGSALVIEAKYRTTDRIALSDLTDTELAHLHKTYSLGGYAMIIAGFSDNRIFLFPFALLEHSKLLYKFKHIKEVDLLNDGYEVHLGDNLYEVIRRNHRNGLEALIKKRNEEIADVSN